MALADFLSTFPLSVVLVLSLASYGLIHLLRFGNRENGLPPGPKTIPILGNIHQFPKEFPQLK